MRKSSGLRGSLLFMWNENCRVLLANHRITESWIHTFPTYMVKVMQVSQEIPCLIPTHSADSEKLKSDVCRIDRLVLNTIPEKIHYGEMCWHPDGKRRNYKDRLNPPHTQTMWIFEDGNREVMKARHGAKGRRGMWWELWHQGRSAVLLTVKTLMPGSACLVPSIYHQLFCLQSRIPGKSWIASPLKTLNWGLWLWGESDLLQALYLRSSLEGKILSMMAGGTTLTPSMRRNPSLLLGGDLCLSPNGFGDMCYLGYFQFQWVRVHSRDCQILTERSMSIFFRCGTHGQCSADQKFFLPVFSPTFLQFWAISKLSVMVL